MSPKYVRLRFFGAGWQKNFTREAGKLKRSSCKFDSLNLRLKNLIKKIVESLLERVKAKVKSIGDNGVYALFKLYFLI